MTQLPVGGPAATTYRVTSRAHVVGRVATPAYLVTDGRAAEGGPSQQVYYVSDAEIASGEFVVAGDVHPIPIVAVNNVNAEYPPIPIYVVNQAPDIIHLHVATTGNDTTGDGSQAAPYATIGKALTVSGTLSGTVQIDIANGTYTLSTALAVSRAKTSLIGESQSGVIINAPLSSANAINITADDVTIKTLKIDGRRANGGQGVGVAVAQAQRALLESLTIINTLGNGISISGSPVASDYGEIKNCTISNLATNGTTRVTGAYACGIQILGGGNHWKIHDCEIMGWSQAIGLWYACAYCEVYTNNLHDNYGYYQEVAGSTRSAIESYPADAIGGHHYVHDNIIDGSTSCCIESAQGDNGTRYEYNTLKNWNAFNDNTGGPISVVDGGALQQNTDVVITHNSIYAPNRAGYVLLDGRNVSFTYNDCHDFIHSSLNFVANLFQFDGLTVDHNTFSNCRGGVYAAAGSNHIITYNSWSAIAGLAQTINIVSGSGHIISHNNMDLIGYGANGIVIDATAGDGHTVQDNQITNCVNVCLSMARGTSIIGGSGHGNTFTGSGNFAIYLAGANCGSNDAEHNILTGAPAVWIDNGAHDNTVIHNTITGGISVRPGAGTGNVTSPNP